jgi:two-component system, LytTR family, response regulator
MKIQVNAILVDDDEVNSTLLKCLINEYFNDIEIIAISNNVSDAIQKINRLKPNLLFLDIEINDKNATDILEVIDFSEIIIILITAFDNYAIEMFKYNISSYLLKPLEISKLLIALKKARIEIEAKQSITRIHESNNHKFLIIPEKGLNILLPVNQIINIAAQGNYSIIYTTDNRKFTLSKQISYYENLLSSDIFLRVHQSHIINLNFAKQYLKSKNGSLLMSNDKIIPISINKKQEVSEKIIF